MTTHRLILISLCFLFLLVLAHPVSSATLPSNSDWVERGIVVEPGAAGSWDVRLTGAISPCSVVKKDGTYFLYYVGADGDRSDDGGPRHRALGVATSTDGIHFTKYSGNPIITYLPNNGEEEGVFSAAAVLHGDTIYLFYAGVILQSGIAVNSDGLLATSTDGFNFGGSHSLVIDHAASGGTWNDELFPVGAYYDGSHWQVYVIGKGGGPAWGLGLWQGQGLNPSVLTEHAANPLISSPNVTGGGDPVHLGNGQMAHFLINDFGTVAPGVSLRTFNDNAPSSLAAASANYDRRWIHAVFYYDEDIDQWFAYFQRAGGEHVLRVATAGGGVPSDELTFEDEQLAGAGWHPSVTVGADGVVHLVYVRSNRVRYRSYSSGSFSSEETISTGPGHWPQVQVSSDGAVHAVWEDTIMGSSIQYARGVAGVWQRLELWGTNRAMLPRLAVDSAGRAHLVFFKNVKIENAHPYGRYVRVAKVGANLVKQVDADIPSWSPNRMGDVLVDANDTVHVFPAQIGNIEHLTVGAGSTPSFNATGSNFPKPAGVEKVGEIIDVDLGAGVFVGAGVEATSDLNSVAAFHTQPSGGPYGVLMDHIGHGHGAPATVAADRVVAGRSFVQFTNPALSGLLAMIDADGTVRGPVAYAEGSGVQHTGGELDRFTNGIAGAPGGGAWLAYQDNRSGSWVIYLRRVRFGESAENQAPQLSDQSERAISGIGLEIAPSYSDPDGPAPYTLHIDRQPLHGTLRTSGAVVTYTSDNGFVGADSFDWSIEDGAGAQSQTATVSLTVLSATVPGDPVTSTGADLTWNTLRSGERVYVDRQYTFDAVPPSLVGLTYLQTANADKMVDASDYLSFTVGQEVTVFVGYDTRLTVPGWLQGWRAVSGSLTSTVDTYALYSKLFSPGTVVLGGNTSNQAESSMYTVIVEPVAAPLPDAGVVADGYLADSSRPDASSGQDGSSSGDSSEADSSGGDSAISDSAISDSPEQSSDKPSNTDVEVVTDGCGCSSTGLPLSAASPAFMVLLLWRQRRRRKSSE